MLLLNINCMNLESAIHMMDISRKLPKGKTLLGIGGYEDIAHPFSKPRIERKRQITQIFVMGGICLSRYRYNCLLPLPILWSAKVQNISSISSLN